MSDAFDALQEHIDAHIDALKEAFKFWPPAIAPTTTATDPIATYHAPPKWSYFSYDNFKDNYDKHVKANATPQKAWTECSYCGKKAVESDHQPSEDKIYFRCTNMLGCGEGSARHKDSRHVHRD